MFSYRCVSLSPFGVVGLFVFRLNNEFSFNLRSKYVYIDYRKLLLRKSTMRKVEIKTKSEDLNPKFRVFKVTNQKDGSFEYFDSYDAIVVAHPTWNPRSCKTCCRARMGYHGYTIDYAWIDFVTRKEVAE